MTHNLTHGQSFDGNIQQLQGKLKNYENKILVLEADLTNARHEKRVLYKKFNWCHQVRANKSMEYSSKVLLEALRFLIEDKGGPLNEFVHLYYAEISRATGIPEKTLTTVVRKLDESGFIEYKLEKGFKGDKKDNGKQGHDNRSFFRLTDKCIENPLLIRMKPSIDKKTGKPVGKRGGNQIPVCGNCYSKDVTVFCHNCNKDLAEHEVLYMSLVEHEDLMKSIGDIIQGEKAEPAQPAFNYPEEAVALLASMNRFPPYNSVRVEQPSEGFSEPSYVIEKHPKECIACHYIAWLPFQVDGEWVGFKCGRCFSHLSESQGVDLTPREGEK